MKKILLSAALLLGCARLLGAQDTSVTHYYQLVEPASLTTLTLHVEEDGKVYGNQHWLPKEMDGAHGTFEGTLKGDIVRGIYSYTIEGSEQSEEQIFKMQGNKLIKAEGDMKDPKDDGHMVFKNAAKAAFTGDVLTKMDVKVLKPGTPERKAIMEALRGPVSRHVGEPVQFTGNLIMHGGWARLVGGASTLTGKPPANENAAGELELDLQAYLKKGEDGVWKPVVWGFAGDVSIVEEAREKCEGAPWPILD